MRFFVKGLRKYIVMCLCMVILAGCSNGENASTEQVGGHMEVQSEEKQLPIPSEEDDRWQRLSTQFYRGEVVQVWAQKEVVEEETSAGKVRQEVKFLDIYLYWEDGSEELLMEDVPKTYLTKWFLDRDGNCYVLNKGIIRLDGAGNKLYHWTEESVRDICQLADGRIMLLIGDNENIRLAELNSDTGEVVEQQAVELGEGMTNFIAADESGLLVLDEEGVWEMNTGNGNRFCAMSFVGTSYRLPRAVDDFCISEDGKVQILSEGELLALQLVDIRQTRTLITIRNTTFDYWMIDWVEQFNKENQQYYVVIEEIGDSSVGESEKEFIERTGVEIATGSGPDIICGGVISDEISLIEKGGLADLTPYMEIDGIKAEDYYPATFEHWREDEKVYGVITWLTPNGYSMEKEVLSDGIIPNSVESLVNDMLVYSENVMFKEYSTAEDILQVLFLKYSESLCGTVDWEEGTCDFSGELFAKVLEVSKRYAYDAKKALPTIANKLEEWNFYYRDSNAALESEGLVPIWYMFDEGCYAAINPYKIMAINNNSPNKEGAWEFISYVLSEEVQLETARKTYSESLIIGYPANRNAFEKVAAEELAEGAIGTVKSTNGAMTSFYKAGQQELWALGWDEDAYRDMYSLTEEDIDEVRTILEHAKTTPVYTQPLVEIVCEEAGAYFSGDKDIEQVCNIIQSRVQLYLDEHN